MTGRAAEFYGSGDIDRLFPGGSPTTATPWASAGPTRTHRIDNSELIHDAVANPERHGVVSLDPRELHAAQPGLQRAAVAHYLKNDYRQTGTTFADQHQSGNVTPVVFHNENTGRLIIRSGHHRAAADLLHGRQFDAMVVSGKPQTHVEAAAFQRRIIDATREKRKAERGY